MDTGISTTEELDILQLTIEGIHNARVGHRILSTLTTKADSVMLAQAALDAINAGGFKIIRDEGASAA